MILRHTRGITLREVMTAGSADAMASYDTNQSKLLIAKHLSSFIHDRMNIQWLYKWKKKRWVSRGCRTGSASRAAQHGRPLAASASAKKYNSLIFKLGVRRGPRVRRRGGAAGTGVGPAAGAARGGCSHRRHRCLVFKFVCKWLMRGAGERAIGAWGSSGRGTNMGMQIRFERPGGHMYVQGTQTPAPHYCKKKKPIMTLWLPRVI